ncbi:reverse transcriptase [Senna tora]|uniref:Reverse transcriptase n=1 Tax=Senna tora TaxID=362788 RepID=A0A835CJ29_9FABA|nr:reverse transcriptase [Senna tora]
MDRNTREIGWVDSSDSDVSGEMEEIRNPNNIIDRPPPSPRPTRAPLVYVNQEHVNANRQFWENCLIAVLVDERPFKVQRLQSIINSFWLLRVPVRVVGGDHNQFVLNIAFPEDMAHILSEGPWSMQGGLLVVFPWEPNLVLGRVLLTEISIWVQLWDIPLEYQTPTVANQVASLMGAVREVDWAPTIPRNLRFMRVGHICEECDWSREQVDLALDAQRQWLQHRFNVEYGLMMERAYFLPEASRFRNHPHRHTTFVRALHVREGYENRPRRSDPITFEFDPWAPLDAHGNMPPPTQHESFTEDDSLHTESIPDHVMETQPDLNSEGNPNQHQPLTVQLLDPSHPDSYDPEWVQLVERFCQRPSNIQHPLPGIRINDKLSPDERHDQSLKWVEYAPGQFGLATGWPSEDPVLSSNARNKEPMMEDAQSSWQDILEVQEYLSTTQNPTQQFEYGESSNTKMIPQVNHDAEVESMTAGTLIRMPSSAYDHPVRDQEIPLQIIIFEKPQGDEECMTQEDEMPAEIIDALTAATEMKTMENNDMSITGYSYSTARDSDLDWRSTKSDDVPSVYLSVKDNNETLKKRKACSEQEASQLICKKAKQVADGITVQIPLGGQKGKNIQLKRSIRNSITKRRKRLLVIAPLKRFRMKMNRTISKSRRSPSCFKNALRVPGRGIRGASTVRRLKTLCRKFSPDILVLQETKCKKEKMKYLNKAGYFDYSFIVNPEGSKGGIGLWCKANIRIDILSASKHWIHAHVTLSNQQQFLFTGVYGPSVLNDRNILWDFLKSIRPGNSPWIVLGDFKQIINSREKLSKNKDIRGGSLLVDSISYLGLIDLPTYGNWFTWTNGRQGDDLVWERIDKTFSNTQWLHLFPETWVEVLPIAASDHSPLVIHVNIAQQKNLTPLSSK